MDIYLYNSLAEPNRVNKISKLTYAMHLEGTLRSECSIISPYIQIEVLPKGQYVLYGTIDNNGYVVDDDNKRVVIGEDLVYDMSKFNYAYIPQFNRYYFINDIISIRNTVWGIDMQVDTLMTYKDNFLNITAFIDRCYIYSNGSPAYNKNIPDKLEPCVNEPYIIQRTIKSTMFHEEVSREHFNCVLATSGIGRVTDLQEPFPLLKGDTLNPVSQYSIPYVLTDGQLDEFYEKIINLSKDTSYKQMFNNISEAIQSIVIYPFNIKSKLEYFEDNVKVYDYWEVDHISFGASTVRADKIIQGFEVGYPLLPFKSYITLKEYFLIPKITEYNFSEYLTHNPYAKLEMYLPYLGWVELNPDLCIGNNIDVYYTVSLYNGNTIIEIRGRGPIFTGKIAVYEASIGYQIPISSGDYYQQGRLRGMKIINGVLGAVSGGMIQTGHTSTMDFANKYNYSRKGRKVLTSEWGFKDTVTRNTIGFNPLSIAHGITNTILDVYSTKNNFSTGYNNSSIIFEGGLDIEYRITLVKPFYLTLPEDVPGVSYERLNYKDRYMHTYGKPSQESIKLSELKDFVKVAYIHLEDIPNATQDELEELEVQLTTGVLL